jgi:hypothetical protein
MGIRSESSARGERAMWSSSYPLEQQLPQPRTTIATRRAQERRAPWAAGLGVLVGTKARGSRRRA